MAAEHAEKLQTVQVSDSEASLKLEQVQAEHQSAIQDLVEKHKKEVEEATLTLTEKHAKDKEEIAEAAQAELAKQLDDLQAKLTKTNEDMTAAHSEASNLLQENNALKDTLKTNEETLHSITQENAANAAKLQEQLAKAEEERRLAREDSTEAAKMAIELQQKVADSQAQQVQILEEKQRADEQHQRNSAALAERESKLVEQTAELKEKEEALAAQLVELKSKLSKMEAAAALVDDKATTAGASKSDKEVTASNGTAAEVS